MFFFLPVGVEGIEKNRDGHYWGYIASKIPGDTTKMGIYGQSHRCGLYRLDVCLCVLCKLPKHPLSGSLRRLVQNGGKG